MRQLLTCVLCGAVVSLASAQSFTGMYAFSTVAGRPATPGTADGTGTNARFNRPWGVAVDAAGNVFIADAVNYTVRKLAPDGSVTTVAGTAGTTGNLDGVGTAAQFGAITSTTSTTAFVGGPFGVAASADGLLFVADSYSHTLRRITSAAQVTTLAGVPGTNGNADGPLAAARFSVPLGIAVDASGNIYVADTYNHVIRRISAIGTVTTIAGSTGDYGSADGIGSASRFLHPTAIAIDPAGRLYVTDSANTIRRISTLGPGQSVWETTTIAGTPSTYGTSDGVGAGARFGGPPTPASTPTGNTVRHAASSPGLVPAFPGFSYAVGELPGIAADAEGNVFVCDFYNNTIRRITPAGVVSTIGGTNSAGATDGIGSAARFSRPTGIAVDASGGLFIADSLNHTIRRGALTSAPVIRTQPAGQTTGVGATVTLSVAASGTPAPSYQWSRNGTPIAGATSATLVLSNVQLSQSGNYTATVTNVLGSVTSAAAALAVVNSPIVTAHPQGQSVLNGQTVILSVGAGGAPAPTLQWFRDGVAIPGATGATLVLADVQPEAAGDYVVVATNPFGTAASNPARVVVSSSRIVNLSIRSSLAGSEALIVGFVASGGSKSLLVRAIGPTLRSFGVTAAMADPVLTVHTNGVLTATNDNWGTGAGVGQLTLAAAQVGAFPLAADSLDAAALATAAGAAMTAQATSRTTAGGIILIELYDIAPTAAARLVNVSARARVGSGEDAVFAGFAVAGNSPKTLLLRAIGPTLGAFGVPGVIADPRLDVFAAGATTPLSSNDNWGGNAALVAAFRSVGAFALPATESRDAALLVVLAPGSYSAQVSGVSGQTGEVLLEIYEVP